MSPAGPQTTVPAVLHRADSFVGRTTNWLYDHLCNIPRHLPIVLADQLENRGEFALLEAREHRTEGLPRRIWRRLSNDGVYPGDARWLRRFDPGLLHSHFGWVAVSDHRLRQHLEVPWVVGFYGADVYELGQTEEWIDRYGPLFENCDRVLALGPRMADELLSMGCADGKVSVHPLGVPVRAIPHCPRELERGAPLEILFAGTFREKKGVEYIVQGIAEARRRGVRLHLTLVGDAGVKEGDAATKQAILREIDRLDVGDIITRLPFLEFSDLIQRALQSHIFLAPSVTGKRGDSEGTPFVLQQMMATAMPILATAHSDIPYIMGEHEALLVPERDPKAIAERLESYADEPDRLVADGRAMREQIARSFDVEHCASRLSDLYDELLNR